MIILELKYKNSSEIWLLSILQEFSSLSEILVPLHECTPPGKTPLSPLCFPQIGHVTVWLKAWVSNSVTKGPGLSETQDVGLSVFKLGQSRANWDKLMTLALGKSEYPWA